MEDAQREVVARPMGDRVLIKVMDPQSGTIQQRPMSFGLSLAGLTPMPNQEPPNDAVPARGIIMQTGPGYAVQGPESRIYIALDVKIGDEVLFFEENGRKLTIDGEELLLLHEQYILVVLSTMVGRPAEGPPLDAPE
jgi:co-chaperonin GroES (HSP10)